jgi:G3E family GTPase
VIKLDTSLCLVDARRVSEQKWRNHQTFQDQVEIADVVVATKCDLYSSKDMSQLLHYLKNTSAANTPVQRAINGEIGADILSTLSQATKRLINTSSYPTKLFSTRPGEGFQKATLQHNSEKLTKAKNSGDGFYSCGWIWPASHWFNYSDILHVFNTINVFRIKGLLITNAGIFGFNGHNSEMDISEYDEAFESRLEIIADSKQALQIAVEAIEKMQSIDKT